MIIGHDVIISDLKKLIDGKKLPHGYVFSGPSMIGKKVVAEAVANYLESGNFEKPHFLQDCVVISPDERGTIGINQVRQIKNFLWQKPTVSARRTLVLDDAQCMTAEAQNALLKITEEPPASSLILLVTNDIDALNPTVSSRLQKLYFSPVPQDKLRKWVVQEFGDLEDAAAAVSKSAGRPGLLHAILKNEDFAESIKAAEQVLRLPGDKRRDFMKKAMDSDDFDFKKLLDSLILVSSWEFLEKRNFSLWHKLLQLRYESAYFNLSPRLQIEGLLSRESE